MSDGQPKMNLFRFFVSGVVRNVTHFGAFVDVGVGTDGLVHVSKMKGMTLSVS